MINRRKIVSSAGANRENMMLILSGPDEVRIYQGLSRSLNKTFATPGVSPTGLTYDGVNVITSDTTDNKIYVHTGETSSITSSFATPDSNTNWLAYDGTNLISLDNITDKIYIHTGISASITTSFSTPASTPSGITYDGTNIISCDTDANKIYVHTGKTSSITTSFAAIPYEDTNALAISRGNLVSSGTTGPPEPPLFIQAIIMWVYDGVTSSQKSQNTANGGTAVRDVAFDIRY